MRHTNNPEKYYAANAPQVGDMLTVNGAPYGVVHDIEGGVCYFTHEGKKDVFIWCFCDGLNKKFSWPKKDLLTLCCASKDGIRA